MNPKFICLLIFCLFKVYSLLATPADQLKEILAKMNKAYTDHNDSLLNIIDEAKLLAEKNNNDDALLDIYKIEGNYYFLKSDYNHALAIYSKGIRLGEDKDLGKGLVTLYYEIAGVYSKSGNKALSLQNIFKGLQLAEKIDFTAGLADGNNRLGISMERENKLDTALICFKKSYELYEVVKDSIGMSYSLENQATSYSLQKKFDEAVKCIKRSLALRKIKNDKYGLAIANVNISEIYQLQGQTDSAIKYALVGLEAAKEVNFFDLLQYTYKHLYQLYKQQKNPELALHYFEQHSRLEDSVFNVTKNRQLAEFSTKFDAERKEQQIKVLNKQKTIQRLGLLATLMLLLVLIILAYSYYRNRKVKEEKLKAESQFQLQLQEVEARNAMQNERLRISRELHDNIGAHLTFINATVDNIGNDNSKLKQVKDLTSETIRELRKTVWLINKSSVKVDEFVAKLRDFLKNIPQLRVRAEVGEPNAVMKAELITELFRTTQESVNNALKYSGADEIVVSIESDPAAISIIISDNGCGFDIQDGAKGFGLENMQHRMQSIGGECEISSVKKQGTCVKLRAGFS